MFNFTLNWTLKWSYICFIFFTTSVWPKIGFKKSCHTLVKILFLLSNTKYMYFTLFLENPKVQTLALIISIAPYPTKESPWIALYNSTHTGVVTLPQCHLFASDYCIRCTLYKNLLKNLNTHMCKPLKYNLLPSTKFSKLGVILCTIGYWLQIHPYWILFETQKRFICKKHVFFLLYFNIPEFVIHTNKTLIWLFLSS